MARFTAALGAAVASFLPVFCWGQPLAPDKALERYLSNPADRQCRDAAFAVDIDASLPKLDRQGAMSGLRLVSKTGEIVYRGLRFTGDNVVKTAVIARYLATEADPKDNASGSGITRQNYSFAYQTAAGYNGATAYVFQLKPKRKALGLFKGELWLDALTAAPLRLWGDSVKSPSIFVRGVRFVQDYQEVDHCPQPLRLLVSVQTRIAGPAEMTMWLHAVQAGPAYADAGPAVAENTSPKAAEWSGASTH
jgi:hypothetical protein